MKRAIPLFLILAAMVSFQTQGNTQFGGVKLLNSQLKKLKINFPFNVYKFKDPDLIQKMDSVAGSIKAITSKIPEGYSLFVVGHASEEGADPYNQFLSNFRARSVFYRLIQAGVDKGVMEWIGTGEKENKRAVTFELRKYRKK